MVQSIALAGQLAFAFSFVIVSLNAMQAGLLSRFMGVLGIIVGVLFVIPLGSPLPVVQCFWLLALAPLFLGRWPNGNPPAWAAARPAVAEPAGDARARMRAKGRSSRPAPAQADPDPSRRRTTRRARARAAVVGRAQAAQAPPLRAVGGFGLPRA